MAFWITHVCCGNRTAMCRKPVKKIEITVRIMNLYTSLALSNMLLLECSNEMQRRDAELKSLPRISEQSCSWSPGRGSGGHSKWSTRRHGLPQKRSSWYYFLQSTAFVKHSRPMQMILAVSGFNVRTANSSLDSSCLNMNIGDILSTSVLVFLLAW